MKSKSVTVQQSVIIDAKTLEQLFMERLHELTEERWVENGKVYTEQYTSHRFDVEVGSADDPRLAISVKAYELYQLLKEKRA